VEVEEAGFDAWLLGERRRPALSEANAPEGALQAPPAARVAVELATRLIAIDA
jgi:hypothetical protein